ncbi:MAG: VOC family protein [Parvibaculaceae bacterium]|nr:VOC family protein [Parvibaculaceae bacterium]
MDLAKPRIDIGLHTNRLEAMLAFWQQEIGLPFDHMLPLGGGLRQFRHDLLGSVLKINNGRDAQADTGASGYRELLIAKEGLAAPRALADPDGNRVTLVPAGYRGITRIGLSLGVRDAAAHRRFYEDALGLPAGEPGTVLCGDSVILFEEAPDAPSDALFEGLGYRYFTIQVRHVNEEHARAVAGGGREGRAPLTLGDIARISFVRDPDGNWIELSQRASLTGSLD